MIQTSKAQKDSEPIPLNFEHLTVAHTSFYRAWGNNRICTFSKFAH